MKNYLIFGCILLSFNLSYSMSEEVLAKAASHKLIVNAAIGNIKEVKEALKVSGVSLDVQDKDGNTPLHLAARNGHLDIVDLLLDEYAANINSKNKEGNTPLHLAVQKEHLDVIKRLLDEHTGILFAKKYLANINAQNLNGDTPLHLAVLANNEEIVNELLNNPNHKINVDAYNKEGNTPLFLASFHGYNKLIPPIITKGANVNLKNALGQTPLYAASQVGHTSTVQELLKHNPDPNIPTNLSLTPLHIAAIKGETEKKRFIEIAELLLGYDKTKINALTNSSIKALQEPLKDVFVGGETALHLASYVGNAELVELLIKHGIDLNVKDNNGNTALHLAAARGNEPVVKLLVEYADTDILNDKRQTAAELAKSTGHTSIAKLIEGEETPLEFLIQNLKEFTVTLQSLANRLSKTA